MSRSKHTTSTYSRATPHSSWWLRWLGRILRPAIRVKCEPQDAAQRFSQDKNLCYVVERNGWTDRLALDQACQQVGLPAPEQVLSGFAPARAARGRKYAGRLLKSQRQRGYKQLTDLINARGEDLVAGRLKLVPVAVYVGRAPRKELGWFRSLFAEDWVLMGWFQRFVSLLLNGRETLVHFADQLDLEEALQQTRDESAEVLAHKVARVLRRHFERTRAALIGPDLSHWRTVVDSVLEASGVQEAIAQEAEKKHLSKARARKQAQRMLREIAADYSHKYVRSAWYLMTWFWNKVYDGISMHHFEKTREDTAGFEVIYVPCHRSHADYLLLSYQLYCAGVVVPHIAAGVNLNLPILGSFLRKGGAFFIRRSFRGSILYSAVFKEYMAQLIARGVPLEYFIEGGRSRTGRLLDPRSGILSMTLRAFLRAPKRPVIFQPVYIGYERLMEGKSYVGELSGQAKKKESWLGLVGGTRKVLKQHYGHVDLSFGEPVKLTDVLDDCAQGWRDYGELEGEAKPEWFNHTVTELAKRIHTEINSAAHVNAINLVALIILSTRKHAIAEKDMLRQIELLRDLIAHVPYAERVSVTEQGADEVIARATQMGWIKRVSHPQGDVLVTQGERAVLMSYFRNNVLHLIAPAAWIACCFINNRRMSRASILRLGRLVYPYLQSELFLRWDQDTFEQTLIATIDFFVAREILSQQGEQRLLERASGQADSAFALRLLARSLMQTFERYYIVVATLAAGGQARLSTSELESTAILTAQRVGLLHELTAPEFFDKALFRGFIKKLKENKVIWTNAQGGLCFDPALNEIVEDARVILARDLRHSVLKMAANKSTEEASADADM